MKSKYGKIIKLTKNLEFVESFKTVREAAHSVGSWASNIYDALKTGCQSHNFYWWDEKTYDEYLEGKKEAAKPLTPQLTVEWLTVTLKTTDGYESFCVPAYKVSRDGSRVEYR